MSEQAPATPVASVERRGSGEKKIFTGNFAFTCLSSFFFFFSGHMMLPALPIYAVAMGSSQTEIGLIIAAFTVSAIIVRPFVGRMVDAGHVGKVMSFGIANYAVSALAYNIASSIGPLLALRLFQGLGLSTFTASTAWLVAEVAPRHRRAEAAGYYGVASNLALALGPATGMFIFQETSFPVLFVACAASAVIALGVSSRINVKKKPDSLTFARGPLFARSAIPPSMVLLTVGYAVGSTVTFVPVYAMENGLGNAGLFFTANAVASIASRLWSGRLADTRGRATVIVPGVILTGLGVSSLALGLGFWGMIASGVAMGVGFGCAFPGLMALVIDRAGAHERGSALSTLSAAFDLGIGLGAAVSGVLAEQFGLNAPFLAAGLIAALGFAYFLSTTRREASSFT